MKINVNMSVQTKTNGTKSMKLTLNADFESPELYFQNLQMQNNEFYWKKRNIGVAIDEGVDIKVGWSINIGVSLRGHTLIT